MPFRHRSFILAALAVFLCIGGSALRAAQNGPKAVFPETVYDAGPVNAGTEITHTFRVKNAGKANLSIEAVKPSCGCAVADFTKVVPPGQEGKITLTVKTDDFRGPIEKTATVQSNDPAAQTMVLTIKSTVRQLIEVLPSPFINVQVNRGQPAEGGVTLVNHDKAPLQILSAEPDNQKFAVTVKPLEKGKRYEVRARLKDSTQPGRFNAMITVLTDHKKQGKLVIPVIVAVSAPAGASSR
jgi:hypothetical protein